VTLDRFAVEQRRCIFEVSDDAAASLTEAQREIVFGV
jgi:hypothetical protein